MGCIARDSYCEGELVTADEESSRCSTNNFSRKSKFAKVIYSVIDLLLNEFLEMAVLFCHFVFRKLNFRRGNVQGNFSKAAFFAEK